MAVKMIFMRKKDNYITFGITISRVMRKKLDKISEKEQRSLAATIRILLAESLKGKK